MWALILDSLAPLLRLDRAASQRSRIRRLAAWLDKASAQGEAAEFRCEPWRFAVPETLLVQLAQERGYRLCPVDGSWSGREAFRFIRDAEAAALSAPVQVSAARSTSASGSTSAARSISASGAAAAPTSSPVPWQSMVRR